MSTATAHPGRRTATGRAMVGVSLMLIVASMLLFLAAPVSATGGRPLHATLTGTAEVPGPGDPDGSGTATLTLNPGQGEICYTLHVTNITLPAAAAHIHLAPAGQAGPVVVPLGAPDATGHASGCISGLPRDGVKAILKNPGDYYVNVHTSDYPPGAVRGQLSK